MNLPPTPPLPEPSPTAGWPKQLGRAAVFLLVMFSTWAAFNTDWLAAKWTAHRLARADNDTQRTAYAERLLRYGQVGVRELGHCLEADDDALRTVAVAAFKKSLATAPEHDPSPRVIAAVILDQFTTAPPHGRQAILQLLPPILERTGGAFVMRCRGVVAEALQHDDPALQFAAAQLAVHPDIRLRAEVRPLLNSADARVRGAALFAAASPSADEPPLSDEELFRWLHDPDETVRKICHDLLVTRERTEAEITLGRRLTHPDATERLKLLLDLRYDDDVTDPEPWLERLSRDGEPAVRAGAARVAVELSLHRFQPCPSWVSRIAEADPHPTVRGVAAFYRSQQTAARGPVRPASSP
ncbi:MAG: hypothetical protein RMJ56_10720 [Gemmataceae bacterium]|nr:hypothetical protein [Gemmata sp.]MDW8198062.1 hypothetical protein [Gemmataceae bacterium]